MPKKSLEERFWAKVDKSDECWVWTACKNRDGYGKIGDENRQTQLAHRISYKLYHGSIDTNLSVLHSCDNPSCVNPHHLSQGTHLDNMRDMRERNRAAKGTANSSAKLTEDQVREIRKLLANDVKPHQITELFGIQSSQISRIKLRQKWTHL